MFPSPTADSSCASGEGIKNPTFGYLNPKPPQLQKGKRRRGLAGNPDPDAEVVALSPKSLLATNKFICEICNKGFQRDQNLQLHRRGHNLPWKLKQRIGKDRKRAYVCPEETCVHHHPSRALGDLTGIKKHYCRKHGEKKWKCEKCSKSYAVQSDWKAHSKICGNKEYRCDCGTLFSRKDSFITHRAFCDALAEETAKLSAGVSKRHSVVNPTGHNNQQPWTGSSHVEVVDRRVLPPFQPLELLHLSYQPDHCLKTCYPSFQNPNDQTLVHVKLEDLHIPLPYQERNFVTIPRPSGNFHTGATPPAALSATALLQKAATAGPIASHISRRMNTGTTAEGTTGNYLTRDFLGLNNCDNNRSGENGDETVRKLLELAGYELDHSKRHGLN